MNIIISTVHSKTLRRKFHASRLMIWITNRQRIIMFCLFSFVHQSNRKVYFSIVNLTLRNVFLFKISFNRLFAKEWETDFFKGPLCFFSITIHHFLSLYENLVWKTLSFFLFGFEFFSLSIIKPEFSNNLSKWVFIYFDLSVFDVIVWSWCSFVHKEIMNY